MVLQLFQEKKQIIFGPTEQYIKELSRWPDQEKKVDSKIV